MANPCGDAYIGLLDQARGGLGEPVSDRAYHRVPTRYLSWALHLSDRLAVVVNEDISFAFSLPHTFTHAAIYAHLTEEETRWVFPLPGCPLQVGPGDTITFPEGQFIFLMEDNLGVSSLHR